MQKTGEYNSYSAFFYGGGAGGVGSNGKCSTSAVRPVSAL